MTNTQLISECETLLKSNLGQEVQIIRRPPKKDGGIEAMYTLRLPSGEAFNLCVVVRRGLRPAILPQLAQQMEVRVQKEFCERWILFTDYVSAPLANRLRQRGFWFVDVAGNAYLAQPGTLFVSAVGQRRPYTATTKGQYFSEAGAKILYHLLCNGPRIQATYRDIQHAIGVSLAKLSKTFNELKDERLLVSPHRGRYEIRNPSELLDRWSTAYEAKLQPRILLGRFQSPFGNDFTTMFEEVETRGVRSDIVVGGEYAADLLTGYLRGYVLNLYISAGRTNAVCKAFRLAPSPEGNIVLYEAFAQSLGGSQGERGLTLAHPVLVYAELLATDDPRCNETALRLKEEHLPWIS